MCINVLFGFVLFFFPARMSVLHVYVVLWKPRVLDLLELEFQVVVGCHMVLGIEHRSSARTTSYLSSHFINFSLLCH